MNNPKLNCDWIVGIIHDRSCYTCAGTALYMYECNIQYNYVV